MKNKIVFISHEATLTGAPILLLNILRHLRALIDYEFVIILGEDGPLRPQLAEIAQVIVYPSLLASGHFAGALHRLSLLTAYNKRRYEQELTLGNVKAIFSNTIVNGELAEKIARLNKAPVVTYVHELAYTIQAYGVEIIKKAIEHTQLFLAGSMAVQRNLLHLGIEDSKIEVVPSSVPVAIITEKLAAIDVASVRTTLNLQANEQLLVAVGKADWRKGNDLFIQLAARLAQTHSQVQCVWVGVSPGTIEHLRMSYEISRYQLEGRFHLVPVTSDYLKYIAAADIFVLSSREDPFPLVVLEAAAAAKPVVCFAETGGAPDFVGTTHGVVVPYGDVAAMSDAITNLLTNQAARQRMGAVARTTVQEEYDNIKAAKKIASLLTKIAG